MLLDASGIARYVALKICTSGFNRILTTRYGTNTNMHIHTTTHTHTHTHKTHTTPTHVHAFTHLQTHVRMESANTCHEPKCKHQHGGNVQIFMFGVTVCRVNAWNKHISRPIHPPSLPPSFAAEGRIMLQEMQRELTKLRRNLTRKIADEENLRDKVGVGELASIFV